MSEKKKKGRPSKLNEKLKNRIVNLFEKGKTNKQVAEIIGISLVTLNNWFGKDDDFLYAVRESKQIADELVEASLLSRCLGFTHKETKVFLHDGEIITHDILKHYPPDATSIQFWLKNRKPQEWREKSTLEHEGEVTNKIKVQEVDLQERIKQIKGES